MILVFHVILQDHNGHVTLWLGIPQSKPPFFQV